MLKVIPFCSLVKVFSDEEPQALPLSKISILKNEKASMQVAVTSDVDVELSVNAVSEISNSVSLFAVKEIYSGLSSPAGADDYYLRKCSGKFPELLKPIDGAVRLGKGKWVSFWVEVVPSPELTAGEKTVTVIVSDGVNEEKVDLVFDVIDACLPEQSLIYTNWFHSDCLSDYYGAEVFSDRYWELVGNYLKVAKDYGMNMVLTPVFTPPLDTAKGKERKTVQLVGVRRDNGEYSFDFSNLDRWIEICDRVGIEYLEISHLFTQWGAKKCPKIIASVDGEEKRIFGWDTKASGKEYVKFLTAFAAAFKPYIYEKGLENRVYFHVSDEPMITAIRAYRKASNIVRELFGEFRIIDALSDFKFYRKGIIKLPIPANDRIEPFIGKVPELWTYYCCAQVKGVSNRFFSMPSARNRVLGYQLYKFGVKGFLHWGYNFWNTRYSKRPVDPFTETDAGGAFSSGDAFVVYPAADGTPLRSLRLSVFNDGLQDMRALQLLESLVGREKTMEILEQGTESPITFASFPHSDEWLLGRREAINDAIRKAITV